MTATLWTIAEVADHLGIRPSSARGTLSRWGVQAADRRIDYHGRAHSLYDPEQVRNAAIARPGRGKRNDLPARGTQA